MSSRGDGASLSLGQQQTGFASNLSRRAAPLTPAVADYSDLKSGAGRLEQVNSREPGRVVEGERAKLSRRRKESGFYRLASLGVAMGRPTGVCNR